MISPRTTHTLKIDFMIKRGVYMKLNIRISLIVLLIVLLLLTSCKSDGGENQVIRVSREPIKYDIREVEVYEAIRTYQSRVKREDIEILDISDGILYIGLINDDERYISSLDTRYTSILSYNLSTGVVDTVFVLKKDMIIGEFLSIGNRIFVSYSNIENETEQTSYYIGEIKTGKIDIIDSFISNELVHPDLANLENKLIYSYGGSEYSIKSYDLETNKVAVFYLDKNSKLSSMSFYRSNKILAIFFEKGGLEYLYILDKNGLVKIIDLDKEERVFSAAVLEGGVLISYEDKEAEKDRINNMKLRYFSFDNNDIFETNYEQVYGIFSIGDNHAMGVNPGYELVLFELYDNTITANKVELPDRLIAGLKPINKDKYYNYREDLGKLFWLEF